MTGLLYNTTKWLAIKVVGLSIMASPLMLYAEDFIDLSGRWHFSEGDNAHWSEEGFNHEEWVEVEVPKGLRYQSQLLGFESVGWYRYQFTWHGDFSNQKSLILGEIHDADEVWLNGIRIGGEGLITPSSDLVYITAYRKMRVYPLLPELVKQGENTIAVRIRSHIMPAGIVTGPVGIGDSIKLFQLAQSRHFQVIATDIAIIAVFTLILIGLLIINWINVSKNDELIWLTILCALIWAISLDFTWMYMIGFKSIYSAYIVNTLFFFAPWVVIKYFNAIGLVHRYKWFNTLTYILLILAILSMAWFLPFEIRGYANVGWWFACVMVLLPIGTKAFWAIRLGQAGAMAHFISLVSLYILCLVSIVYFGTPLLDWRDAELGLMLFVVFSMIGYLQRMRAAHMDFQALSNKVMTIADQERQNLARELHDGFGQQLATLKLRLGMVKRNGKLEQIEKAETVLDTATEDLRYLVKGLKPAVLENASVCLAIRQELEVLREIQNIDIEEEIRDINFSNSVAHHFYRAFQECLHNAVRHSQATKMRIELGKIGSRFWFQIEDNGVGFDINALPPKEGGVGLLSLQERLSTVNASIHIDSHLGKGTKIIIDGPV